MAGAFTVDGCHQRLANKVLDLADNLDEPVRQDRHQHDGPAKARPRVSGQRRLIDTVTSNVTKLAKNLIEGRQERRGRARTSWACQRPT
jgi:hypothetical protein